MIRHPRRHASLRPDEPRRRPSPALALSCIALFAALTGTGYAAVTLARDSVGAVQIKRGAVASSEVKDASLRLADISSSARASLRGRAGAKGERGEKGEPGSAAVGVESVSASSPFNSSPEKTLTVKCPAGKRLLGGGAGAWGRAMISLPEGVALTASHPYDDTTWLAAAHEVTPTEQEWFLQARAVCANTG